MMDLLMFLLEGWLVWAAGLLVLHLEARCTRLERVLAQVILEKAEAEKPSLRLVA